MKERERWKPALPSGMLGVGWEGNPWRSTHGQVRGGHILESSFLLWLQKLSLNCFHFSVGKVLKELLANSLGHTLPRAPLSFSGPTLDTDFILHSTVTRSDFFQFQTLPIHLTLLSLGFPHLGPPLDSPVHGPPLPIPSPWQPWLGPLWPLSLKPLLHWEIPCGFLTWKVFSPPRSVSWQLSMLILLPPSWPFLVKSSRAVLGFVLASPPQDTVLLLTS